MQSLTWTRANRVDPSTPPAVLIGHLNLIRPLALAGVPIVITVTRTDDVALRSRFVNGYCLIPGFDPEQQPATVGQLLAVGAELAATFGTRLPLIYGNDDALAFIHQFRHELERCYLLLLNDDDLAAALADKALFYQRCAELDLLVPRTLRLGACSDLELARLSYPAILKPRAKTHWHEMKRDLFGNASKARVVESAAQVINNPVLARYRDDLVITELVPGGDEQLYSFHGFADPSSRILASFTGRKVRTYPPGTGESSFIELCKEPALVEVGRSFVKRLGVRGPFKIDLKKSSADGLYYALEINARYNLWHYLGAVSGINLPAIAYRYLLAAEHGLAGPGLLVRDYRLGFRWLDLYLDSHTAVDLHRRGEMSYGRWLVSLLGRNVYSAFAWRDPMPFVQWAREFVQERLSR